MAEATSPAATGLKMTSTVSSPIAGRVTDWPASAHEKGPGVSSCEIETVAGSTPSLRSVSGSRCVRPTSSLGKCSSGSPASVRALGAITDTCGSVPSAISSKVSSFVSGLVPSSTAASSVAL